MKYLVELINAKMLAEVLLGTCCELAVELLKTSWEPYVRILSEDLKRGPYAKPLSTVSGDMRSISMFCVLRGILRNTPEHVCLACSSQKPHERA